MLLLRRLRPRVLLLLRGAAGNAQAQLVRLWPLTFTLAAAREGEEGRHLCTALNLNACEGKRLKQAKWPLGGEYFTHPLRDRLRGHVRKVFRRMPQIREKTFRGVRGSQKKSTMTPRWSPTA